MSKESIIHIALTGHRPNKLDGYDINQESYHNLQADLEQYIRYMLTKYDKVVGHSGLALGGDTVWAQAIVNMKEKYPERVRFFGEIPNRYQSILWQQDDQDRYWELRNKADHNFVYDVDFKPYDNKHRAAQTMFKRNRGMVNHADIVLALIWPDEKAGGTYGTIKFAKQKDKEIVYIDPGKYFD